MKTKKITKVRFKTHKELGSYFRDKRLKAKLSQEKVAKKLGYKSIQIISNWERGLCSPPKHKLKEITKFYKLNKNEVLDFLMELSKREYKKLLGFTSKKK